MRPKRSLGQNFLKNANIAEKMASLAEVNSSDTVFEIGPGKGMLTQVLLKYTSNVIAIEKDDLLFEYLQKEFLAYTDLKLIHQDILNCDLVDVIPDKAKIIANLPYNIATNLIMQLVEIASRMTSVVVMIQKEVAERICAPVGDKEYSFLSAIVAAGFDALYGFVVGPNNFSPKPRVDSMVIKLIPKTSPIPLDDLGAYRQVISVAFAQKRKILKNNLLKLPSINSDKLTEISAYAGIDLGARAQEISFGQYYLFSKAYREHITGLS